MTPYIAEELAPRTGTSGQDSLGREPNRGHSADGGTAYREKAVSYQL